MLCDLYELRRVRQIIPRLTFREKEGDLLDATVICIESTDISSCGPELQSILYYCGKAWKCLSSVKPQHTLTTLISLFINYCFRMGMHLLLGIPASR